MILNICYIIDISVWDSNCLISFARPEKFFKLIIWEQKSYTIFSLCAAPIFSYFKDLYNSISKWNAHLWFAYWNNVQNSISISFECHSTLLEYNMALFLILNLVSNHQWLPFVKHIDILNGSMLGRKSSNKK